MKPVPSKSPVPSDGSTLIESAMGKEVLRSQVRRVTLLIALLGSLLVLVVALRLFPQSVAPDLAALLMRATVPLGLLLAVYLVYEVLIRAWLRGMISTDRLLPRGFEYLNVLVEVSLPTLTLLIGGYIIDPVSIVAGAIPFLYFLFILLAALSLDFWVCVFAGVMGCAQFLAVTYWLLGRSTLPRDTGIPVLSMLTSPHQYLVKGVLLLAGGIIAGFVALQIRRQLSRVLQTLQERDRAVSIFGQHVSPEVADLLLKQPLDYAGQERNVCVMFLDIRDFSTFSSGHTAPEVVEYLNALFGPMIPIINSHSGVVNKFLGDGFMAVFGAPLEDGRQCHHAIHAALEILQQVDLLNQEGRIPPTRLGIGLHFGQAVTGNVGSSERKEYTIIGDVVNLASRIEQANKPLASQLLISEAVARIVGLNGEFAPIDMGMVDLKGQPQPVRLYKLA